MLTVRSQLVGFSMIFAGDEERGEREREREREEHYVWCGTFLLLFLLLLHLAAFFE